MRFWFFFWVGTFLIWLICLECLLANQARAVPNTTLCCFPNLCSVCVWQRMKFFLPSFSCAPSSFPLSSLFAYFFGVARAQTPHKRERRGPATTPLLSLAHFSLSLSSHFSLLFLFASLSLPPRLSSSQSLFDRSSLLPFSHFFSLCLTTAMATLSVSEQDNGGNAASELGERQETQGAGSGRGSRPASSASGPRPSSSARAQTARARSRPKSAARHRPHTAATSSASTKQRPQSGLRQREDAATSDVDAGTAEQSPDSANVDLADTDIDALIESAEAIELDDLETVLGSDSQALTDFTSLDLSGLYVCL